MNNDNKLEEKLKQAKKDIENLEKSNKKEQLKDLFIKELKEYWGVDELKFVAQYNIPKNNDGSHKGKYGFFINLRDYYTQKYVSYPNKKGRISVFQHLIDGLEDGNYYYVTFRLASSKEKAKSKKPHKYLLSVKEIEVLDKVEVVKHFAKQIERNKKFKLKPKMKDKHIKETEEQLIKDLQFMWDTTAFKFIGKYEHSTAENEANFGYINNIFLNDRAIQYPENAKNTNVSIRVNKLPDTAVGKYYVIYAKLASAESRKKQENPYLLIWDEEKELEATKFKTPQEFIKRRFVMKGENPSDAATIAKQLKLNELELYTQTHRFVFELIQNADDMPFKDNEVNINIFLTQNFLLFLHNGKFFNREDVRAITDAAHSTKELKSDQTGYKGIGFKSVFSDSSQVFIKSGSYSFKFDKTAEVYQNFWELYKHTYESKNELAKEEFKDEYTGKEQEYIQINKIPWQIKPIWVEQDAYPGELINSPFNNGNHQVSIGLNIGEGTINDSVRNYHKMITELISEPRFLLFLRNTNSITYNRLNAKKESEPVKLQIEREENSCKVFLNEKCQADYLYKDFKIEVTNENFEKAGFDFEKIKKDDKVEFIDKDGKKLENIPEKLAVLNSSKISFSAKIENKQIIPIDKEESILFNYLPTSEKQFEFKFLVNADFVSKTDREFIQVENRWNHYLFYHIGYNLIKWLAEIASTALQNNNEEILKSYLKLLPNELFKDTEHIRKGFNNGLKIALEEVAFLPDISGVCHKHSAVINDSTGIFKVLDSFGVSLFNNWKLSDKKLASFQLDEKSLTYNYLGIEQIKWADINTALSDVNKIEELRKIIIKLPTEQFNTFLDFINLKYHKFKTSVLLNLPLFIFGERCLSINEIAKENQCLVDTDRYNNIKEVLQVLNFNFCNFNLSRYPSLYDAFKTHLVKDIDLYDLIKASDLIKNLGVDNKVDLLNFISKLVKGATKYTTELSLFSNQANQLKPLNKLLITEIANLPKWLQAYQINEEELDKLPQEFKKYLIKESEIFAKILANQESHNDIITQLTSEEVSQFYNYITRIITTTDKEIKGLHDLNWLYTSEHKFVQAKDAYFPDNLCKLEDDKFKTVSEILEALSNEKVPVITSMELIKKLSLGSKKIKLIDVIEKEVVVESLALNTFFDWAEAEKETELLNHLLIEKIDNKYKIKKSKLVSYYYASSTFNKYISVKDEQNTLILFPTDLYTIKRHSIGLLENDALTDILIENNLFDKELIHHIDKNSDKIKVKFLLAIDELSIFTKDKPYDKASTTYKIVDLATSKLKEEADKNNFKKLISVDETPLLDQAISTDIYFNNLKKQFSLKLSDLLPEYNDNKYSFDAVIEALGMISNKLKPIFSVEKLKPNEIFGKIHQLNNTNLTPEQVLFLCFYKDETNEKDPFRGKNLFSFKDCPKFIDLCFREEYKKFGQLITFKDFVPHLTNLDTNHAFKSELPPQWIINWLQGEEENKKLNYLVNSLGVLNDKSEINKLRNALLEKPDLSNVNWGNIKNAQLFTNTLHWLKDKSDNNKVNLNESSLKNLYEKAGNFPLTISTIPIPVLSSVSPIEFKLINYDAQQEIHLFSNDWATFKDEIFKQLSSKNILLLKSESISEYYKKQIKTQIFSIDESIVDEEKVWTNSISYEEGFYTNWDRKNEFKLKIYDGEKIPHKTTYGSDIKLLESIGTKDYIFLKDYHIITSTLLEKGIPDGIKDIMGKNLFRDLNGYKDEYYKNLKEKSFSESVEEFIDSLENSTWAGHIEELKKLLLGGNLNSEKQKAYNLMAKIKLAIQIDVDPEDDKALDNYNRLITDNYGKYIVHSARGTFAYIHPSEIIKMDEEGFKMALDWGHKVVISIYSSPEDLLHKNDVQLLRYSGKQDVEDLLKFCEENGGEKRHLLFIDGGVEINKKKDFLKFLNPRNDYK